MDRKPIIINQRIPLHILEVALISLLNEEYSREYINEQLSLEFTGENRIKKATTLVNKLIIQNKLKEDILENKDKVLNAIKKKDDRNIILISIVNSALPFGFDVLAAFGKYFSVQDIVSSEAIKRNVSAIYGGNRSMENALYAIIPMFLEAGFFSREKTGVYKTEQLLTSQFSISKFLYEQSYRYNKKLDPSIELNEQDGYFYFFRNA